MKDWKEKSLSQAGKEVLIKAVIQAIPSYAMSCFLFPITLCQEIEKASARFFWSSSAENRKCHWANWDVLTTPKVGGGIGFRELSYFNIAMIAKQVWNLVQKPNSIIARMLKAKYYRRTGLLQATIGYNPSYLCRSLLAAKEVIDEGSAWRIGNGRCVNITTDRWVGVTDNMKVSTAMPPDLSSATVEKLINVEHKRWNEELIYEYFHPNEAKKIVAMPLSSELPEDRRVWRFTKYGLFTVRSAYHSAVRLYSLTVVRQASPSSIPRAWKKLWEMKVIPRIKMFLWRACTESLPTRIKLCQRKCIDDPICILCGEEEESLNHLMLRCRATGPIWYGSRLRIDVRQWRDTSFRDFLWSYMEKYPAEVVQLLIYTAWEIWKGRNEFIFEQKPLNMTKINSRAWEGWNRELKCRQPTSTMDTTTIPATKWTKPRRGVLKLNCDIAVGANNIVGLGFLLRDYEGSVILAGKNEINAEGSITLLELLAIRHALQLTRQYHMPVGVVECDNLTAVKNVMQQIRPEVYADVVVEEIRRLAQELKCEDFFHVPRQANKAAHNIAHGPQFLSIKHAPIHVSHILHSDVTD